MNTPKVIAVVGPTASGKSALGVFLAQKLRRLPAGRQGEIISADSRQVYRGMRVISRAGRGHMVGIADPRRQFSAGEYVRRATRCIDVMIHGNKVPIVVGGTGLYADALLGRMPLPQVPPDRALRAALRKRTAPQLMAQLRRLDPARAAQVDPHNKVRLMRAVEIAKGIRSRSAKSDGKAWPSGLERRRDGTPAEYQVLWLGLREPKNLKKSVEARLKRGMVAEAKKLRAALPRRRYRELGFEFDLLADYLDKRISKIELAEKLTNGERKYAVRQMRWFRRNKDIRWVGGKAEALRLAKKFLGGR